MALLKLITSGCRPFLRKSPRTARASVAFPALLHAPITELNVTIVGATPSDRSILRARAKASRHSPARSCPLMTAL